MTVQARTATGHHIRTIFVSAYLDYADCTRALRRGAVCFLTKPFSEDELLRGLRMALAISLHAPWLSLGR